MLIENAYYEKIMHALFVLKLSFNSIFHKLKTKFLKFI